MTLRIRVFETADYERVLEICIAAFAPIHRSFREMLGEAVFDYRYHDWKDQYADYLGKI